MMFVFVRFWVPKVDISIPEPQYLLVATCTWSTIGAGSSLSIAIVGIVVGAGTPLPIGRKGKGND